MFLLYVTRGIREPLARRFERLPASLPPWDEPDRAS